MWEVWIFQTLTKLLREFFARNFSRFLNWFSSLFDNYLCNYLCYFVFWNSPSSPSENSFGNANRFGNSIQLFFWCIFSISLENFSTNAFRNPVDKLFEEYFGNFFKKNPCRRNLHLFFKNFAIPLNFPDIILVKGRGAYENFCGSFIENVIGNSVETLIFLRYVSLL